jgi:hypothetical protein
MTTRRKHMSMKPILFSIALALGSNAIGATKIPVAPNAQVKNEAELAKCQEQLNALSNASTPTEREAAAQCQFWIAEQGYAKFTTIKRPETYDKDKLATWLNDSKKQREDTSALYLKVNDLDNKEQSVAALARIGLMSYQFATNIQNMPMPTSVEYDSDRDGTPEIITLEGETKTKVQNAIRAQFAKVSAPVFEDAKKAFEGCAQLAKDNKLDNDWSKLCVAYVALLTPTTKSQ